MNREELFEIWAPPGANWSLWAKPVLFAHAANAAPVAQATVAQFDLSSVPRSIENTALVVELPGAESVEMGVSLAQIGYQPVPIFNAAPGSKAVVPVQPIISALAHGASKFARCVLPANAPPAFLIDANRMRPEIPLNPGVFDNRSVVFPQDFPSAQALSRAGIRRVVTIQRENAIQNDLQHVLRRWQEAGLVIWLKRADQPTPPSPIEVPRPSRFRALFYRFATLLRFRRSSAGAFGSEVPDPYSGGLG